MPMMSEIYLCWKNPHQLLDCFRYLSRDFQNMMQQCNFHSPCTVCVIVLVSCCRSTLQLSNGRCIIRLNCPFPLRDPDLYLTHGSWAHPSPHCKRNLYWFSRFVRLTVVSYTDRHTDCGKSVTIGRIVAPRACDAA